MKRTIVVLFSGLLFSGMVMANDFKVQAKLGKHTKTNPNGVWTLEKKSATSKQIRAKILPKEEGFKYPCLEYVGSKGVCWDIRIIDRSMFKKEFVGHDYYHFYWKKKKNQGYTDPHGEAINATISPIPQVMVYLKNNSGTDLELLDVKSKSIYQQGGTADSNEHKVKPKVRQGAMEISHDKSDKMTFPKGFVLASGKGIWLPFSLWVKNAAKGDGTGDLAYALELHYKKKGKAHKEVIMRLLQGDGEGYDVAMGGIATAN